MYALVCVLFPLVVAVAGQKTCEVTARTGLAASLLQQQRSSRQTESHAFAHEPLHSIDTKVDDDKETAVVEFTRGGQLMQYNLFAFSVFSSDVALLKQTATGMQALEHNIPWSFRSYEPGAATATITDDGHVYGLFRIQDEVLSVRPKLEVAGAPASLTAIGSGSGKIHFIEPAQHSVLSAEETALGPLGSEITVDYYDPKSLFPAAATAKAAYPDPKSSFPSAAATAATAAKVAATTTATATVTSTVTSNATANTTATTTTTTATTTTIAQGWKGTKWWPGCYTGDEKLHEVKIGIVVDFPFYKTCFENDTLVLTKIEAAFSKLSLIYEHQLNARIRVADVQIVSCETCGPGWLRHCDFEEPGSSSLFDSHPDPVESKLQSAALDIPHLESVPFQAAHMVLTSCESKGGSSASSSSGGGSVRTLGVAVRGGLCNSTRDLSRNVGVVHWAPWMDDFAHLVLAHELGHLFGASHSFEDGKHTTGGIMDYGRTVKGEYQTHPFEVDGVVQFNTKYRKTEVCTFLDTITSSGSPPCDGKFQVVATTRRRRIR